MQELECAIQESNLADLVAKYHREQQGQLPKFCSAHILPDMAIVRTSGIFTSTEETLCASAEGKKLIQSARREQRTLTRREIESRVSKLIGKKVTRSYYDLDVRHGEQIEVYIFE